MSQIVKRKAQYCNGQQHEVDDEAPEFIKDPHDDFVWDEHRGLLQIRTNLLQLLPRGRLVRIWVHELSPLYVQRWTWISTWMAPPWFWLGCGKAYALLSRIAWLDWLKGGIRVQTLAPVSEVFVVTSLLLIVDVTATIRAVITSTGGGGVSVVWHWNIQVIVVCATFLIGQST